MSKTAAHPEYQQYAGYGQQGYHPGLDDPRMLEYPLYQEPKKPDEWPSWAMPTALIAGGLGGALLLKGLGGVAARRAKALMKRAPVTPAATEAAASTALVPTGTAAPRVAAGTVTPNAPGARGVQIAPEYAEALAGKGLAVKTSSIIQLLGRIARQTA